MKKFSSELNLQIKPLRTATCPTLSGKSTLTYELGTDSSKALHFRITENDGGGFFSAEWIPWKRIEVAIGKAEPVTSICLRPLFRGKSVNSSGFLLSILRAEGLVESLPNKVKHFKTTSNTLTATKAKPRKPPAKKKARK